MTRLDELTPSRYDRVVAAEVRGDGGAVLFVRDGDQVLEHHVASRPFLVTSSAESLKDSGVAADITQLAGLGPLSIRADFGNQADYEKAMKSVRASRAPMLELSDPVSQLLVAEEFRLFRGMDFKSLRRMQFDIETLCPDCYDFPNPEHPGAMIVIISMRDSGGWDRVIHLDDGMDERALLEEFVNCVIERDPDVIEGHNIFRFDLPYIEIRAKMHKVKLKLGRGGVPIVKRNSRFSAAERVVNYTRYDIFGRHVIDTCHLCIFYDVSHRDLESYNLKYVARHFGVAAKDRCYIDGDKITEAWHHDRGRLLAYALDDVRETAAISAILSPSYFYQAQIIPMKYQDCVVRGNATRINALLLAEYLRASQALPLPESATAFSGALTESFQAGVFKNVWHCDVRSLYPSIIIADNICPARDSLGVFPAMLDKLRRFRLEAKSAERSAKTDADKDLYNALQTTFKVLINSFYGYLGFAQGNFNDYAAAAKVTARGREILGMMLDYLRQSGANVIEMDTDGIYFQPPDSCGDPAEMEAGVQKVLPDGIEVELDAVYPAMFAYKSKNYALLRGDGELSLTGAALKSRGIEAFQRDYIHRLISCLLHGDKEQAAGLAGEFRHAIRERLWPLEKFAKSETLSDSLESYRKKLADGSGRRSAAYELAIASGRPYLRGDQVSFYITGTKKRVSVVDNSRLLADAPAERDENVEYYLDKLEELRLKFADFVTDAGDGSEQLTFDLDI